MHPAEAALAWGEAWEEEKQFVNLHCFQSWASVEIIRGEKSLACANFLPPLQNKIIKRMCARQRQETPTVPGSLLPVMEYSYGVSHDKTQKVVLSPCLSRYTLITAAVCLCACACVCAYVCVWLRTCMCVLFFFCAGMLSRCLPCQLIAWHLLSCS